MRKGRKVQFHAVFSIEGACKDLAGRRLKQTGACWRVEQANRIAVISTALYSSQWENTWEIPKKI